MPPPVFSKAVAAVLTVAILFVSGLQNAEAGHNSSTAFFNAAPLINKVAPYLSITEDGLFIFSVPDPVALGIANTEYQQLQNHFTQLNAHIAAYAPAARPFLKGPDGKVWWNPHFSLQGHNPAAQCVTVPKWALQAFAWAGIAAGGAGSIIGAGASGTIMGLPAGLVLTALGVTTGITYSYLLWVVDNQVPDSGLVVCW